MAAAAPRPSYLRRQWLAVEPLAIWAAYLALFALHIIVRSYGDAMLPARSPQGIDQALTGTDPSRWLQHHLYGRILVLDKVATGAHLAWYAFPFLIGAIITIRRRDLLVPYLAWLTAMWFVCDGIFYLAPARPPWMVDGEVTRMLFTRGWVDYAGVDTNPVAAFPSLHAGIPLVIGLFLWARWREARVLRLISVAYAALVGFAVVYLGEHWLIDVLGGYAVACAVWGTLGRRRALRRFRLSNLSQPARRHTEVARALPEAAEDSAA